MDMVKAGSVGSGADGLSRRTSQAVQRVQEKTVVELARMRGEVIRHEGMIRGITQVSQTGMQDVALVSADEVSLVQMVPSASGHVSHIADLHARAVAGVVIDVARALGRCQ